MSDDEITKRVEHARVLHRQGCNCCQSVVLAFDDLLPIDQSSAAMMVSAFGRGISGLREVCGCVSGIAMVCGLTNNTTMVKPLANKFREINGELTCAKLLQIQGAGHSCNDLVACATRLVAEIL